VQIFWAYLHTYIVAHKLGASIWGLTLYIYHVEIKNETYLNKLGKLTLTPKDDFFREIKKDIKYHHQLESLISISSKAAISQDKARKPYVSTLISLGELTALPVSTSQ
jgi:hypothetical protein